MVRGALKLTLYGRQQREAGPCDWLRVSFTVAVSRHASLRSTLAVLNGGRAFCASRFAEAKSTPGNVSFSRPTRILYLTASL